MAATMTVYKCWLHLVFLSVTTGIATTVSGLEDITVFNISCDPQDIMSEETKRCDSKSLASIAASATEETNILINIKIPRLRLNGTVTFANLSSLTISGEPGTMSTLMCTDWDSSSDTGIVLKNISSRISFSNLNVTKCGLAVNNILAAYKLSSDSTSVAAIRSALAIVQSRNVNVNNMVIEKSKGLGLAVLDHQGDSRVSIISTIFKENKQPLEHNQLEVIEKQFGGGGVYLKLDSFPTSQNENTFTEFVHTDLLSDVEQRQGRGGGAYIYLKGDSTNVQVSFTRCRFISNQGFLGGGLSVVVHGEGNRKALNMTVVISDSQFEGNGCDGNKHDRVISKDSCDDTCKAGFGGGLQFTIDTVSAKKVNNNKPSRNKYIVINTNFTNNFAEVGGGVSCFSYQGISDEDSVIFEDCLFNENRANIGSAVAMTPTNLLKLSMRKIIPPQFINCDFLENTIVDECYRRNRVQKSNGIATMYANMYNIEFQGSQNFKSNVGSAIHIVNGLLNFTDSDASFSNNTSIHGGALSLVGTSMMIVGPRDYEFLNNTAYIQGGAIFVFLMDRADFTISRTCFIQYGTNDIENKIPSKTRNANMYFYGNKCSNNNREGHAIFATSVHSCRGVLNDSSTENHLIWSFDNFSQMFLKQGVTMKFDDNSALQPQVATDGYLLNETESKTLEIIPGEMYSHGVKITDDLGNSIHQSFKINIEAKGHNDTIELDPNYSAYIRSEVKLAGEPGDKATIYLAPASPRHTFVKLAVKLISCPPGYKLNENSQCICNAHAHFGLLKCDDSKLRSYLLPGFWAGDLNGESTLVTSECFFCNYNLSNSASSGDSEFEVILPQNFTDLNKAVCGRTRVGTVCGRCAENYTVHFHSPGYLCKPAEPLGCKVGWLLYIVSELLPVTTVFIIVLVLNVNFTSGFVNGFILYSQLLSSLDIYAGGITVFSMAEKLSIAKATAGYRVMYGFFNLDFLNIESLSFCFWKNASALDMIAVKYITILYTVLLIVTVILVMNKCGGRCLGKCCRITTIKLSVTHGISTFLVICYAQCIKVSLSLLLPVHLHAEKNSSDPKPSVRVWFNGEVEHLSRQHWPYAIPAIFILITVGLVPPALLLTYPLLNKGLALFGLEEKRPFNLFSSAIWLKPLLDSFQGCYKDNFRFFAGLYFLYRWTFLSIHWNTGNFGAYFTGTGGILLFMFTLHTICQPYIKREHNIIDALLFANLILINALSFFNFHKRRSREIEYEATVTAVTIQLVLIYLPLAVIFAYFLTMLCWQFIKYGTNKSENFATCVGFVLPKRFSGLLNKISSQNEDFDSIILDDDFVRNYAENSVEYQEFEVRES